MKKIVGLLAIAFLLFFIITDPTSSAGVLKSILDTLGDAARAIAAFFKNLF